MVQRHAWWARCEGSNVAKGLRAQLVSPGAPAPARPSCSGKPLAAAEAGKTGRKWRHPSAVTAIKTAALRTLCQALVPDNPRARPSQVWVLPWVWRWHGLAAWASSLGQQ